MKINKEDLIVFMGFLFALIFFLSSLSWAYNVPYDWIWYVLPFTTFTFIFLYSVESLLNSIKEEDTFK